MMVPVLMLLMAVLVTADESLTDLSTAEESDGVSLSVVRCDAAAVCPDGTTCCLNRYGQWGCCPYIMGQCCRDGAHCCQHGYYCDVTSSHCVTGWLRVRSSPQLVSKAIKLAHSLPEDSVEQALERQDQDDNEICDEKFYCPKGKYCCKTSIGQWGCCHDKLNWSVL